ncbi:MAG: C1 family peptidase [Firmicutes bacterium]|nr:C1 family peptidase [Bacillota bacterium]MBR1445453.1 C1 family peptidase [Bacillota bacterium]
MRDYRKCGLGCFKDKPDSRDYVYAPAKAANVRYPIEYMLENTVVKDQGEVNSCVAHSISTIKEIQEYYETKKKLIFSVGWIYGFRVENQYRGEGMYPREALNNLIKYGDVLQSDFPENFEYNDIQNLISKRKASCITKAANFKCKSYARVTSSNDVKSCLYTNHSPVMVIAEIYDSFYKTGKDGVVRNEKSGSNNGGHAMTIVGWKKIGSGEYWIVQNSWGVDFADKGYCYIRFGSNIITDLYTVTDLQNVRKQV